MRRFQRRDDALALRAKFQALERFLIGRAQILRTSSIVQRGVLRTDGRIIESGRNGMSRCDLAILVLEHKRPCPVQHSFAVAAAAGCCSEARRVLPNQFAASPRFHSDKAHLLIGDKRMEKADGI